MKIVVLDGYSVNPGDLSWNGIKELGDLTVYDRTSPDDVVSRVEQADIVLTNKVVLSDAIMAKLPNLKYIGVLATGVNIVDIAAARKRGVIVTNVPAYSTDSVVQMTFAHILNITNRVAHYSKQNRNGRWSSNEDFCYWDTPLNELAGKLLVWLDLVVLDIRWHVLHVILVWMFLLLQARILQIFLMVSRRRRWTDF